MVTLFPFPPKVAPIMSRVLVLLTALFLTMQPANGARSRLMLPSCVAMGARLRPQ